MKSIAVFCLLVAGAAAASYSIGNVPEAIRIDSGYGQQRFIHEAPQLTRVIESTPKVHQQPAIRVAEALPVRIDSSYGATPIRAFHQEIPITRFNHLINTNAGEYNLDFASANGIVSQESGFLKALPVARVISEGSSYGSGYGYGHVATRVQEVADAVQTKSGTSSWCSPEGLRFTLTYTADELGYHPVMTKGPCETAVVREAYAAPLPVVREAYSAPAIREIVSAPAY